MIGRTTRGGPAAAGPRTDRRWLVGFEPVSEHRWLPTGGRSAPWDVEGELVAVAVFGGVTVDLTEVGSMPSEVRVDAYAIAGNVDVFVPRGTRVRLTGRHVSSNLRRTVPSLLEDEQGRLVRLHVHELLGDVSLRFAFERRSIPEPVVAAVDAVPVGRVVHRRPFGWGAASRPAAVARGSG
ncbi:MAG: hypothetical protein ABSF84_06245 [Acidimicrobiales bacterium]